MKNIPLLGMGTWGMGGKFERDESNIDESVEALSFGLSLGIRMIDVAELYGEGLTEEIVGRATRGMSRENYYLASKVSRDHLAYDDVLRAAEGSLKRLNVEQIDLYMVHKSNELIPLKETMEAMERLLDEGKIGAIGVSNFTVAQMEEAQSYLKKARIAANQIEYNLQSHEADRDVIPYANANDIHIIAHRPFAKGSLIGNTNLQVAALARIHDKTENQIALNWIISQGITAIPKSSNHTHLKENAGALDWKLTNEDIETLRNAT